MNLINSDDDDDDDDDDDNNGVEVCGQVRRQRDQVGSIDTSDQRSSVQPTICTIVHLMH